ncbi:nuclear transport factor 2 family protein [Agromyces sp. C10]|jgi:alkanesulfonate monooxygenase SsuD/methylene tetrahydromethanopterin reductase-like flavin-dependent oxidoreductase (luciferase family)|uniref:nuclear transport factor 2 family protein n=1 Tax=Agromyces sp. C10 TaxID=2935077 RepID=UPI00200B854B|nr:nuclear transport factor 2 family protein [Agromyces sp. C10]MCK8607885.1 nuclear transport factor 2 family protein [Agromyces sp. C10]
MDVMTEESTEKIARAFSSHRFDVALPRLADDVIWTVVGSDPIVGRKKVKKAVERTAAQLAEVTTEFQRFRSVVGEDSVVVDSLARYTDAAGDVSIVASCDLYDFDGDGCITEIVSYTIALPS